MDEQATAAARATWSLGDYASVAELLVPAAEQVAAQAGPGRGRPAVDVAAGTGSVARALARDGWETTACDITPALIARGRRRSEEEGLVVRWEEAPLDDLPLGDATQTLYASSFGLIFAPDPAAALAEAARVLQPNGLLVFSAWSAAGYMAEMTARVMRVLPDPPGPASGPFVWGDPDVVRGWLTPHFEEVGVEEHTLPWRFASSAAATAYLFENSPGHIAARSFAGDRSGAMEDAVRLHLDELAGPDGQIDVAAEYLVVTARRR